MALAALVIAAFLLRVIPQLDVIFTDSGVMFRGVDPYHHLRLIENMMANWPHALSIDYYAIPGGMDIGFPPLLNWIIAGISKLGLNYEYVAAFTPPVLGALIAIPVYLTGKTLFGRTAGYVAAALVVFLPTELLNRSLLGFTDHHVLEAFFMAWTLFFAVKFIKVLDYKWAVGAGVSLGLYIDTWLGGMLFVGILFVGFTFQFLQKPSNELLLGFLGIFLIGYLLTFLYLGEPYQAGNIILMPVMIVGIATLNLYLWDKRKGLVALGCLALVGGALALFLYGTEINFALRSVFWGFDSAISEAQPSYPYVFVGTLGVTSLLMFPGAYYAYKKGNIFIIVVWVILFLAMIGQRRWGYYFVIPVSLLSAFFITQLGNFVVANMKTAVIIVSVAFILLPSSRSIIGVASQPNYMNDDYYSALLWLRQNTPEPFSGNYLKLFGGIDLNWTGGGIRSDAAAYYVLDDLGNPDYTVLAWWDYGHWITRVGHRVPMSNPAAQISIEMRQYLMAQSQAEAESYLVDEEVQPKYIFATREMTSPNKYYAIVFQLGYNEEDVKNSIENSMASRLWEYRDITYKLVYSNQEVKIYERG